jgi:hypothetical protein
MEPSAVLIDRRRFLRLAAFAGTAAALAACTPASETGGATTAPASLPPTASLPPPAAPTPVPSVVSPIPTPDSAATILVKDVVEFELRGPYEWNGGSVTMLLHEGRLDGEPIYFVRTDTSDEAFANEVGLVWVPLLRLAFEKEGGAGRIFLFGDDAADGQLPVLSTGPGLDDFTPLYRVNRVSFRGEPTVLDSAAAIDAAVGDGSAEVEETDIVVNYPVVKWPGGELPVDTVVEKPLEGGPLLAAPDVDAMVVTFKLHQCFPESRYIVTDTSAVPMAPMMAIEGSPGTEGLAEAGAASTITVFGNGLNGPGAMGFQPGIFREKAGEAAWSPLWDHLTAVWKDETKAVLVTSQAELDERVAAGEIEIFKGTPDTDGQGFVVNCPSPIVAPNDFEVTS